MKNAWLMILETLYGTCSSDKCDTNNDKRIILRFSEIAQRFKNEKTYKGAKKNLIAGLFL